MGWMGGQVVTQRLDLIRSHSALAQDGLASLRAHGRAQLGSVRHELELAHHLHERTVAHPEVRGARPAADGHEEHEPGQHSPLDHPPSVPEPGDRGKACQRG